MHILVEVFSKLPAKAAVMLQKLEESRPGEVHNKKKKKLLTLTLALTKEVNEITKQINKCSNRENQCGGAGRSHTPYRPPSSSTK